MRENSTPPATLSLHAEKMQAITNPKYSSSNNYCAYA